MEPAVTGPLVLLSAVGLGLLVVSGWLGGKMVYEAGVGVDGAATPATPRSTPHRHINA